MIRCLTAAVLLVACAGTAAAATEATLLRLFLIGGGTVVSFGEYARLNDRVVFSIPVGGTPDQPRLHVVSLPVEKIDWPRTEQHAASARYQWYARTRGEADFERLSGDVARVLNEVAQSTDRRRALTIAEGARRTLADWPAAHFGYRQDDVREIVTLLDEAIANLRASIGMTRFDLALVASAAAVPLEPVANLPSARDQLDQLLRVTAITERAGDRVALFHAALGLLADGGTGIAVDAAATMRNTILGELREEAIVDARYDAMARRVLGAAARAADSARIAEVERILNRIPGEDRRLGRRRPEDVEALRASVQVELDGARRLRLLRDRWTLRIALYRDWQRSAGVHLLQLVKVQPALEAIRQLEGPSPSSLAGLRSRLDGGADRLLRIGVNAPADLRAPNELLTSAWRFAESAVTTRAAAVSTGNVATAWEASSAAAASLLLLQRAQQEIRSLLEPPRLR